MTDDQPRFDSAVMLDLALDAQKKGLWVSGLSLRDRSHSPLSDDAEEEAQEAIITALRSGHRGAAIAALLGDRGPLHIISIELVNDNDDSDAWVTRDGTILDDERGGAVTTVIQELLVAHSIGKA